MAIRSFTQMLVGDIENVHKERAELIISIIPDRGMSRVILQIDLSY